MELFKDPENLQEVIQTIKDTEKVHDIITLINKIYPTWIYKIVDNYSDDYKSLDANWERICKQNNKKKTAIFLVEKIIFGTGDSPENSTFTLINIFCDILTLSGFVVRDRHDLTICLACNKALPTEGMYNTLKKMNIHVPQTYSNTCSKC